MGIPSTPARGKIYLRFEVWNEATHVFDSLPADTAIDLMDHRAVQSDRRLDTKKTDAGGGVTFETKEGEKWDIYFLAHTKGISIGPNQLPDTWSTRGWKARDGQAGYYEKYVGTQLGDAAAPLVFRIGLDFHIRLTYERPGKADEISPKGIPVTLNARSLGSISKKFRTDAKGEVHGLVFDADPGVDLSFTILFEIEDPDADIKLPRSRVQMKVGGGSWNTWQNDKDLKLFRKNDRTSIGQWSNPEILRCSLDARNVALYFLKILCELHTFLLHITGGTWTGLNLAFYLSSASGTAYSWPVGDVNIPPDDHWNRSTLIHEMSHQVMWKEAGISTLDVVYQASPCGDLHLLHSRTLLSNPVHALIEGWAEFMSDIFVSSGPYTFSAVFTSKTGDPLPLGPPPDNRGESVEGAFANGLWEMFATYVVGNRALVPVPETANGDVTSTAPWVDTKEIKDRFKAMIWDPLRDLPSHPKKDTTAFIDKMKSMHIGGWHTLAGNLQKYNLAMAAPTIKDLRPAAGPTAGGQDTTITGTNFVAGTQVRIGGVPVTVTLESSTSLKFQTPPGKAGDAELELTTPSGTEKLQYRYLA